MPASEIPLGSTVTSVATVREIFLIFHPEGVSNLDLTFFEKFLDFTVRFEEISRKPDFPFKNPYWIFGFFGGGPRLVHRVISRRHTAVGQLADFQGGPSRTGGYDEHI